MGKHAVSDFFRSCQLRKQCTCSGNITVREVSLHVILLQFSGQVHGNGIISRHEIVPSVLELPPAGDSIDGGFLSILCSPLNGNAYMIFHLIADLQIAICSPSIDQPVE